MKRSPYRFLLVFAILFVTLGIILYFINPLAPLMLLLSLVVQGPLIFIITRTTLAGSYADRAFNRREQYEKDKDAAAWLAGELKEANSATFNYFSKTGKMRSALNRAQPLVILNRTEEAAALLAQIDPNRLAKQELERYTLVLEQITPPVE